MSGMVTPSVIAEQRKLAGNPDGKGKAKKASYSYHIAKAQNTLQPKIGETLSEPDMAAFILANPNVRVTVN